jgi:demethylmenaquinone methyltransferase / 2-methoxy-6-polyprenyl-1,4-benzoquinol methylase
MMSEKKESRPLQKMFSGVPQRYDLINRIFTLKLDERWRARAVEECLGDGPARVMDLCTGTGDLALRLASAAGKGTVIIGADFSMPMLAEARMKAAQAGAQVLFIPADASELPFKNESFHVISIGFGFRNLTYRNPKRDRYLAEILRVLAPGGRFVIVESSQPRFGLYRALVHLYVRTMVSFVGGIISGQKGAYRYLAHSAIHFYGPEELCRLLEGAGFKRVRYRLLLGGVAAIHVAHKE